MRLATISNRAVVPDFNFHDALRERQDAIARNKEKQDQAFENDFSWFHINLYCDRKIESGIRKINEVMSLAMNNLYCNEEDCTAFEQALFAWYCSNNNEQARDVMRDLLDKHIKTVYREEWELRNE